MGTDKLSNCKAHRQDLSQRAGTPQSATAVHLYCVGLTGMLLWCWPWSNPVVYLVVLGGAFGEMEIFGAPDFMTAAHLLCHMAMSHV